MPPVLRSARRREAAVDVREIACNVLPLLLANDGAYGRRCTSWFIAAHAARVCRAWAAIVVEWRAGLRELSVRGEVPREDRFVSTDELYLISRACPQLREIHVSLGDLEADYCPDEPPEEDDVTDFGVQSLVYGCPRLRRVSLNCFHHISATTIASLRRLDLEHLEITECHHLKYKEGRRWATELHASAWAHLRSLTLINCIDAGLNRTDTAPGLVHLAEVSQLDDLCLGGCDISPGEADHILRHAPNLSAFHLQSDPAPSPGNKDGNEVRGFLRALSTRCHGLKKLELSFGCLDDDIEQTNAACAALVSGCQSITDLSLNYIDAPISALKLFVGGLRLKSLNMDGEGIDGMKDPSNSDALWAFALASENGLKASIESFTSRENSVSPAAARMLLTQAPKLTMFELYYEGVGLGNGTWNDVADVTQLKKDFPPPRHMIRIDDSPNNADHWGLTGTGKRYPPDTLNPPVIPS